MIQISKAVRIHLAIGVVFILLFGGYSFYIKQVSQNQIDQVNKEASQVNFSKRLNTDITLDVVCGHLDVLIQEHQIEIQPFEIATSSCKSFVITEDQYPKLFEQGIANLSFITIRPDMSKSLIIISNNQPSHGDYVSVYQLEANPTTGVVINM